MFFLNWSEEAFVSKKFKKTVWWLLVILTAIKLFKRFRKKNCKRKIKKNLESKKYSKAKVLHYM